MSRHIRDWRYPRLPVSARSAHRERKLREVVDEAFLHVPFYRELFASAGLRREDVRMPEDLARLPVIRRSDLAGLPDVQRMSERLTWKGRHGETSSGSTGTPMRVQLDARARRARDLRFLRALRAVGYRPGQSMMLVTDRTGGGWLRVIGWNRCSLTDPPAAHARALETVRPRLLYGCTTPLRLLADWILETEWKSPTLGAVVTTAELMDGETRERLREAFACPVYDFYGLSEVGLVAAEAAGAQGYLTADEGIAIELPVAEDAPGLRRIVVTDLEARVMPFLRYDTGDLARIDEAGRVRRIEGRAVDCLVRPDGSRVSPYSVTKALEVIDGLRRYSVVQSEPGSVVVRLERGQASREALGVRVRDALAAVLGPDMRVLLEEEDASRARTDRRVVECTLPPERTEAWTCGY